MTWRRAFGPEAIIRSKQAIRFCAGRPSGCSHTDERADGDGSRMIVDAGVDAAALARVPQILQRR